VHSPSADTSRLPPRGSGRLTLHFFLPPPHDRSTPVSVLNQVPVLGTEGWGVVHRGVEGGVVTLSTHEPTLVPGVAVAERTIVAWQGRARHSISPVSTSFAELHVPGVIVTVIVTIQGIPNTVACFSCITPS